jgi:hypothetical protein
MGTGRFTISIQFQICRSSCTGTSRKWDFIRDKEKKSQSLKEAMHAPKGMPRNLFRVVERLGPNKLKKEYIDLVRVE